MEPAGWLRDWAVAARNGITGHLDERHRTFRDGWKDIPPLTAGNRQGWPLEQCGYWLDEQHMLPFGVASGQEYAAGVGTFRKTETCDVAAMLLTTSWLYRILGDGDWGDRMERAFFNAGAAPVARDFQNHVLLPVAQPPAGRVAALRSACSTVRCCLPLGIADVDPNTPRQTRAGKVNLTLGRA